MLTESRNTGTGASLVAVLFGMESFDRLPLWTPWWGVLLARLTTLAARVAAIVFFIKMLGKLV